MQVGDILRKKTARVATVRMNETVAIAAQLMGLTMLIPVLVLVRCLQGLSTATAAPATLGFLSAQTATTPASVDRDR